MIKAAKLYCLFVFLTALITSTGAEERTPPKSAEQPSQKSVLTELDKPITLSVGDLQFEVSPPKGYKRLEQDAPFAHIFAWQGPPRADGTCASLMLTVMTPPSGAKDSPTLNAVGQSILNGVKRHRQNWNQLPAEQFILNGRKFERIYWTGVEPTRQLNMRGYEYVTAVGRQYVIFAAQDIVPYDKSTLPIGEHCIESFAVK